LKAAAMAAAIATATSMAGTAQAVALNPDGLGQVLIYPYYTVRANADGNAYDSLFTVVNAKSVAKAVRVRFREGKAGHEVLDFNLYLAANDVWTAAVIPTATGAALFTNDTSCTNPNVPRTAATAQALRNYQYTGPNQDLEDQTLDRTKEGYVEIIEMGDFARPWVDPAGNVHDISPTEIGITHAQVDGEWKPPNCGLIRNASMQTAVNQRQLVQGTGGLFGNMTLINVNTARAIGYDAVALSGFYQGGDGKPDTLWFASGSENPHLGMAHPPTSTVIDDNGNAVESTWASGLDAVSSVLMRGSIINEFNVAEVYAGATDWVVTMPTKYLYFDRNPSTRILTPRKLFQREFRLGGAPDDFWLIYSDREGRPPVSLDDFCTPPYRPPPVLSWSVNVVGFRTPQAARTVLHSTNSGFVSTSGCETGWAQMNIERVFNSTYGDHTLTADAPSGRTFTGLPVVGFSATLYNNAGVDGGSLGRVWASYVATVPHRYERTIQ
ncbi:MAG: hypothetical protein FWC38_08085, partial [Proteobacteria bacterium]|nr:hypothetical protein [Pseudomonadota bacterium]MCL2308159.1 hypothetical protein [Pseudomonadota bacterium]